MFAATLRNGLGRMKRDSRLWWLLLLCALILACGVAPANAALAAPVAEDDRFTVMENHNLVVKAPGVLRNDNDVDGLSAAKLSNPRHGRLTLNGDGSFVYRPDRNFAGRDSFTYGVDDGAGGADEATVRIFVRAAMGVPIARDDNYQVSEGGTLTVPAPGVLKNDTGDRVFTRGLGTTRHGSLDINRNGSFVYTPDADYDGRDYFTYRNVRGDIHSNAATAVITVNPVNPTVVLDGPNAADEGQTKTYTYTVTDPGEVPNPTITTSCGQGATKSNETQGSFDCTFPDGDGANGTRYDVSVSADDGDGTGSDTQSVTVANVAPTADGQSVTTDEDTAKTITLTGSDPVGAADSLSFKITSLPADGTLYEGNGTNAADEIQPSDLPRTLAGNQVTYEPDANSNGSDAFDFKINDGDADSSGANVSIQVNAVNDAPTVGTESGSASYAEGGQEVEISPLLTVIDPDTANLAGATVSITTGLRSGDTLSFDTQNGISGTYNSGVLTLTGSSSVENYQTALRSVRYSSTSNSPGASRTVSFQVNDGEAANNLSNTATRDVSITETNSAPVVTTSSGATAFTENGPAVAVDDQLTVTDSDSSDLAGATVSITANFASGQDELLFTDIAQIDGTYTGSTGVLTLTGNASVADYQAALRNIRYDNTSDTPNTNQRTVSFQVDDGSSVNNLSNTATKDVSIAATNDAPEVDLNGDGAGTGHSATFTEDGPAVSIVDSANLAVTDADDTNIESATVTITNLQDGASESLDADVGATGITKSYDSATGVLTLGNSATRAQYQQVLRTVTYNNTSQSPGATGRNVTFVVNDGDDDSNIATSDVAVNAVNDSPALTQPDGTLTYTEDTPSENHAAAVAPNLTVDDVDDANLASGTVQITTNLQSPQDELLFTNQNGISATGSGTGSLTLSGSATKANWQTALRSVQYRNTSDAPNTSQRTVSFRVSDGHTGESPDSNIVTRDIEVVATNDAPVADNETFSGTSEAIGNTSFVADDPTDGAPDPTGPQKTVTGDILDGDTDPDNAPGELTVKVETKTTADGGSITFQADGDFTYHPPAGCDGGSSDTVQYTVEDNHPTDPKTGNGTLTINISQCIWYVDDSAPGGGDGRSHSPYNSLTPLNNSASDADAAGERIFLYDGTYTGGLALEDSQPLFTEKHGLVVGDGGAGNLTLEPGDGSGSTLNGGLAAASGNNVQGLSLGTTGSSSVYALSGTSVGSFSMNNVTGGDLNNPAGGAINIGGTGNALTIQFGTLSSSGSSGNAVSILNASGTVSGQSGTLSNATGTTVNLDGGSLDFTLNGAVSDDAGQLISIRNKTSGTTDFNGSVDDVTSNPNNGGGISLQSNGTALTRFDGGLNLSTGPNNGLVATGGGTLAIPDPAAASNKIATTTGTALNVTNTTISSDDLTFESISSNGATNGIVLNNTGTSGNLSVTGNGGVCTIATPTCSGGTIQSTTGDGVSLTNTSSPSFNLVHVLNTAGHGISGTTTSGLSLSNSLVQGAGDADNEAGLFFANVNGTNLTGNSSITNTVVHAPADVGAFIQNYGGSLNLTVSGSTFSGTQKNTPGVVTGDDLMRLVADGSPATITASFTGNTFDRSESDGIAATAQSSTGSGGGTLNLTADGNTLTGDNGGSTCPNGCNDNGFQVHATQDGTIRFTIQNNNIQNQRNEAIAVVSDNTADVQGTIQNNTIGTAATSGSGSLFAQGIFLAPDDNADLVARVHNNLIRQTFFQGIWAEANDGSGGTPTMDVTLTNNTTPTPADTSGTVLGSLEVWGTTKAITCAKVENNTAATGVSGGGSIELLQADTATFKIEGLPAPTNNASAYVASKNPASSPPINAIAAGSGSTFTGGTCRTPAATPTP